MLQQLRKIYRIWTGKSPHVYPDMACHKVWYGNDYGGFYICPDSLNAESIVYSVGIGKDISFDEAVMQKHGARVFAFDPTPDSIEWVRQNVQNPLFNFLPYGIGKETGKVDFFLPANPEHVSGSVLATALVGKEKIAVQLKTLADMMQECGHAYIDVLKMDIEGAEYDVIPHILQSQIPIKQLLLEFHGRVLSHQKTHEATQLLREHGYKVFGISSRGEEISFVKVDA